MRADNKRITNCGSVPVKKKTPLEQVVNWAAFGNKMSANFMVGTTKMIGKALGCACRASRDVNGCGCGFF